MPSTPFTALLARRMTALDLKAPDVATACGVQPAAAYAWAAGEYQPERSRFATLADVLRCDVAEVALAAAGIAGPESATV